MKSICLDGRKLDSGGIGTYLRNLLALFPNDDTEMTLLVSKDSPDIQGVNCIACDAPNFSLREQFVLPQTIPKCDLFWSPHFNIPLFPTRAKRRLITIHDLFHLSFASHLNFAERTFAKVFIAMGVSRSDHIITVSEFSKKEILTHTRAREEQITVIHNGIDFSLFHPSHEKGKGELPENYFLFVGNQKKHKNLRGVLKSFGAFLNKTRADVHLVTVGTGEGLRRVEDMKTLEKEFSQLSERVISLGHVEEKELPLLYSGAIGLVFPSFYEGFGLPPLEGMACGCPAIVSRIPSLEEVCGEGACYVDPYDTDSIAHGMELVYDDADLRRTLIEKGNEQVKKYSWKRAAEKHWELIK